MNKKLFENISFAMFFLIILTVFTLATGSTNYYSNVTVITSGGTSGITETDSTNYLSIIATGDIIGNTSSDNYTTELGLLYSIYTNYTSNNAPVATTIPDQNWSQDTNKEINLSAYFSDSDNDILTYTSTTPSNIQVSISNNIATLTPNSEWSGTNYITFISSDGLTTTNSNSVTLTVTPIIWRKEARGKKAPGVSYKGSTEAALPSKLEFILRPGLNKISDFPPGSALELIEINILYAGENAKIIAQELSTVNVPKINAYTFLEILALDAYFDKAEITFKVDNNWIISNDIDKNTITIMLYGQSWTPLKTEIMPGTHGYTRFKVITSELGLFAITGKTKLLEPVTEMEEITPAITKELLQEPKITKILNKVKEQKIEYIIGASISILGIIILILILLNRKNKKLKKIEKLREDINRIEAKFEKIKKIEREKRLRKIKKLKEKLDAKIDLKEIKKVKKSKKIRKNKSINKKSLKNKQKIKKNKKEKSRRKGYY